METTVSQAMYNDLKLELAETKQAIAFWMDVSQLLAREKGHHLETIRQLRLELAETKQAMLLGVLSE